MDRRERLGNPVEAMLVAMDAVQARIWTTLVCIVESYDPVAMTVEVQPAIQAVQELPTGETQDITLPLLVDVPVVFPSAKGYALTFPIEQGDEVLVLISRQCIDNWWGLGADPVNVARPQQDMRMHDLSDGFCLPGPRSRPNVLPNVSPDTMQLRNEDGDTYVEIDGTTINIVAPGGCNVTAPLTTVTGDLKVTGTTLLEGDVHMDAALQVDGNANVDGTVKQAGHSIGTNHFHNGVTTGGGNSGPVAGP